MSQTTSARKSVCRKTEHLFHDLPDLHERRDKDGKPQPYFGEYPKDYFDFISSTSAIVAARKMKAHGAAFWSISLGCSARLTATTSARTTLIHTSISASRCLSIRSRRASTTAF
jgi:hypothetical protein